jgi:hypothetical protein
MARFAVSGRTTIAGTSVLPNVSLYSVTTVRPVVREVGLFNTTAVAVCVALYRLTSAATQGAALVEVSETDPVQVALATAFAGHTAGTPVGTNLELRRASLGAAIGSGIIWTFGDRGLEIPNTTADGVGVIVPTGTGQILDYYISWDE